MIIDNLKKDHQNDRLICALDFPSAKEAISMIDTLGETVGFYKIGLELMTSGDFFFVLSELNKRKKRVFADLKFYDIPQTVASAIRNLSNYQVDFCTVHADRSVVQATIAHKGEMKVLAVTVLTSHSEKELGDTGCEGSLEDTVLLRARNSILAGASGVIASGRETKLLRAELGNDFLIVTPGIRANPDPQSNKSNSSDDQKRTVDAHSAIINGADYLVVGRPICRAENPRAAAINIQESINSAIKNQD